MFTSIRLALVQCWTNWTRLIHDWLIWNWLVPYLKPCRWGHISWISITSHGIGGHGLSAWLGHGIWRLVWRWVAWFNTISKAKRENHNVSILLYLALLLKEILSNDGKIWREQSLNHKIWYLVLAFCLVVCLNHTFGTCKSARFVPCYVIKGDVFVQIMELVSCLYGSLRLWLQVRNSTHYSLWATRLLIYSRLYFVTLHKSASF